MGDKEVITELWTAAGVTEDTSTLYVDHHLNCDVPEREVRNGVKQVTVHAYGDTEPPNVFLSVTASSEERARQVWDTVSKVDFTEWWKLPD